MIPFYILMMKNIDKLFNIISFNNFIFLLIVILRITFIINKINIYLKL